MSTQDQANLPYHEKNKTLLTHSAIIRWNATWVASGMFYSRDTKIHGSPSYTLWSLWHGKSTINLA